MTRKPRALDTTVWIVAIVFCFLVGVFLREVTRPDVPVVPTTTTVAGCTSAISFVINEDGTVTTSCPHFAPSAPPSR